MASRGTGGVKGRLPMLFRWEMMACLCAGGVTRPEGAMGGEGEHEARAGVLLWRRWEGLEIKSQSGGAGGQMNTRAQTLESGHEWWWEPEERP